MDWKPLKRDPSKLRAALAPQADGSIVAIKPVKIYVPERYAEKQLAVVGSETFILGIHAITTGDEYYAVSRIDAMMRICPTAINTVKFDQDTYLEFVFDAGAVVLATTGLVMTDTLVYQIFDEHISKGNVPWAIAYDDLARLFESSDKHAGVHLANQHSILAMIAASITRQKANRAQYYRHGLTTESDKQTVERVVIPLRSVTYGATNTTSKLVGAYWNDGLTSALVNPAEKQEKIEELLLR